MKYSQDMQNIRSKIVEHEDKTRETMQNEGERNKSKKKKKNSLSDLGIILRP